MQKFEFGEKVNVHFYDGNYRQYYYMGEHIVSDNSPAVKLNPIASGNKAWDEDKYSWTYRRDISKIETNAQPKEQAMKIQMNKQYRTRDGQKVRILCVDRYSKDYPVVGLIGNVTTANYTETGKYFTSGIDCAHDLIEYNPAMDLKIDQPLWVRDSANDGWEPRHFARVDKKGRVCCWAGGCTSHTSDEKLESTVYWQYWSATKPE